MRRSFSFMNYIPERGDAVWLDLNPQAGREQAGRRPVLVISPKSYNGRVGLALVCPIANKTKGYPFEVRIPDGLKVTGFVLSDHVKSSDWKVRNVEFICKLPNGPVLDVTSKLGTLFEHGHKS